MITMAEAVERANARKAAAMSVPDDLTAGIVVSGSEETDRAVYAGLDVDYDELRGYGMAVGVNTVELAALQVVPLISLFCATWTEGLLIGLIMGREVDR
jgi:hypothetical protein